MKKRSMCDRFLKEDGNSRPLEFGSMRLSAWRTGRRSAPFLGLRLWFGSGCGNGRWSMCARWLEHFPLLLVAALHIIRSTLDLTLHLRTGITYLSHGAAHGPCDTRNALAPEEEQDEQQDHQQFPTAYIKEKQNTHQEREGRAARTRHAGTRRAPMTGALL